MSKESYRYPYGLNWFELTVLRLLYIIAVKHISGEKQTYLHRLNNVLFDGAKID